MNTVLFVNATIGFSENLFLVYIYPWPVNVYCIILTAQTDISQTHGTFSLKINKLSTCFAITQV